MNRPLGNSVDERLSALDEQIRRRAARACLGYAAGMTGAVGLYFYLPFSLCRIASLILVIGLAHMIWKVYEASRGAFLRRVKPPEDPLLGQILKVDAQVRLIQSAIHNLPFLVGANLFLMGLPGPGSAEGKAWLDCFFLLATVLVFSGLYLANQQTVRKQLLPLRQELVVNLQHSATRRP